MEVKEVVKIAIDYVANVFSAESPSNIGLEEITFDEENECWKVTVGFSRPWDYQTPGIVADMRPRQPNRQYKVVKVSDTDGKIKAIEIYSSNTNI